MTPWRDAVLQGLHRYRVRNGTSRIERQAFLREELNRIVAETGTRGLTPAQTISKVLQDLRDTNELLFSASGVYTLTDQSIDAAQDDFEDDIIEQAIAQDLLTLPDTEVGDQVRARRVRKGVEKLHDLTLLNYGCQCALCDTIDRELLISSHIARWADRPDIRGNLRNTICFCALHDQLFEHGYFGLRDDFTVILRPGIAGQAIPTWLDRCTGAFRCSGGKPPLPEFLAAHRSRVGLAQPA